MDVVELVLLMSLNGRHECRAECRRLCHHPGQSDPRARRIDSRHALLDRAELGDARLMARS